jgi:UDP-glucose 4-epimerase
MKNIAITGISGYIGTRLLEQFDGDGGITKIIGIDNREPQGRSTKLKFYQHDIREPFDKIFIENNVDTAIHLAFVLRPTRETKTVHQIDVDGMANLIDACRQAKVKHIIYLSSHTIYGAHADNPVPLTEASPVRPTQSFQYSKDKGDAEAMLRDFMESHSDIKVTILRACPVIGPNAVGTPPTIMFKPLVMVGVIGCDPPMQFVHEDDLKSLIGLMVEREEGGIFNVAGDGALKYSEVARRLNKKLLKLPGWMLKFFISMSWATHLQSASPAGGMEFIKYMPVVSTEKVTRELGFRFRYTSEETLVALIAAYKK